METIQDLSMINHMHVLFCMQEFSIVSCNEYDAAEFR